MSHAARTLRYWAALAALSLVYPVAASAAQPAPLPSQLGPKVSAKAAISASGFVGHVSVTPTHGPVGTQVAVEATGLPPHRTVQIVWRTVKGRWNVANGKYRGRTYTPVAYQIAKVTADASGNATAHFVAPDDFGFTHDVVVQQGDRELSQAGFYIDMTVTLATKKGPEGSPISVNVEGIGWRPLQNSWLLLYDNRFTGWISSVTTGGSAHFSIPATGAPGVHELEVIHGGYTFPYRNMQQSPEPDRPQFAIPFTITAGKPVLPPPPPEQTQKTIRHLPKPGDLTVTPAFSPVGAPITVTGTGFTPDKPYPLDWTTVTGNRVSGHGWAKSSKVVARAKADAAGKVTFKLDAPDDLGGAHQVWIDDNGTRKTGTLTIQATALPMPVTKGPVGTPFTIHLKGVGWTETANIFTIDYDNSYVGYACGFNSQGDVVIHLTATGKPGIHYIDLYPAIYKGKEKAPKNFRLPQLTYAADHPGEDLPHFRFAFKVTPSPKT